MFSLKVGHNRVLNQKNVVLLPGKAENKKYTETETWQFRPSLGPKKCFLFCLILQEFWGLSPTLFDIPEDVVFVDILVFSNIFGFPVVNWAQKRNKTVNFRCLPFILKFKILKDFLNSVFLIADYLWSKFQQDWKMFGGVRAQPKNLDAESV